MYVYDIPEGFCAGLKGNGGGRRTREGEDEGELCGRSANQGNWFRVKTHEFAQGTSTLFCKCFDSPSWHG
jgi:hypothetical protein